jgi:hypothetical protein
VAANSASLLGVHDYNFPPEINGRIAYIMSLNLCIPHQDYSEHITMKKGNCHLKNFPNDDEKLLSF